MNANILKIILINAITLIRLLGSFFVPLFFSNYGYKVVSIYCLCLFLTDCIDGFLARKLKSCTFFGSLCDAFSDKTLAIISLFIIYTISPTIILLIIIEILISLVNILSLIFNGNAQSSKIGKTKTWFLGVTIVASLLLMASYDITHNIISIIKVLSSITLLFSFITFLNYADRMISSFKTRKALKKETLEIKSFKKFWKDMFNTSYFNEYKTKSYKYLLYFIK